MTKTWCFKASSPYAWCSVYGNDGLPITIASYTIQPQPRSRFVAGLCVRRVLRLRSNPSLCVCTSSRRRCHRPLRYWDGPFLSYSYQPFEDEWFLESLDGFLPLLDALGCSHHSGELVCDPIHIPVCAFSYHLVHLVLVHQPALLDLNQILECDVFSGVG